MLPVEGYDLARRIGADSYAECGGVITGELVWTVLEDITKAAARTTTDVGAKSEGSHCV